MSSRRDILRKIFINPEECASVEVCASALFEPDVQDVCAVERGGEFGVDSGGEHRCSVVEEEENVAGFEGAESGYFANVPLGLKS